MLYTTDWYEQALLAEQAYCLNDLVTNGLNDAGSR